MASFVLLRLSYGMMFTNFVWVFSRPVFQHTPDFLSILFSVLLVVEPYLFRVLLFPLPICLHFSLFIIFHPLTRYLSTPLSIFSVALPLLPLNFNFVLLVIHLFSGQVSGSFMLRCEVFFSQNVKEPSPCRTPDVNTAGTERAWRIINPGSSRTPS